MAQKDEHYRGMTTRTRGSRVDPRDYEMEAEEGQQESHEEDFRSDTEPITTPSSGIPPSDYDIHWDPKAIAQFSGLLNQIRELQDEIRNSRQPDQMPPPPPPPEGNSSIPFHEDSSTWIHSHVHRG